MQHDDDGNTKSKARKSKDKSKNALTHGFYAQDVVLPWEDRQQFLESYEAIREELKPRGALEEDLVLAIAELRWRRQRIAIHYLLAFYQHQPSPELMKAAREGTASLASYLAAYGGQVVMATEDLLNIIKENKARRARGEIPLDQPLRPKQDISAQSITQAYDPSKFEQRLKLEAMFDNRLSKLMGQLIGLKSEKARYAEKTIEALPSTDAPALAPPEESNDQNPSTPAADGSPEAEINQQTKPTNK